ncbi:MAG: Rpn family recombination-promoting nuclease/putative transposase, partial [Planctomycetaceae bacterium]|nr:Rpn family recombination-promoting nuclease/putative transposase [Planctomycetaceae bacterium]
MSLFRTSGFYAPLTYYQFNIMQIANPIYDVVFKFMMEDKKTAKSFISAIIEEEVLEIDFAAQERTLRLSPDQKTTEEESENLFLTVCRFDFSAKLLARDGNVKTVMIELQKAKMASDVMRFRRYIGSHYQSSSNTDGNKKNPKACSIYCIFLLGYDIGIEGHPIL